MKFIGAHIFDYDATFRGDVTIEGNLTISNSVSQTISFGDNDSLYFGNSNDLQIVHDSANSKIENSTGQLTILNTSDDKDIVFRTDDGGGGVTDYVRIDGSHTRTKFDKKILVADGEYVGVGDGADLQIMHNGTNTLIDNITGDVFIRQFADNKDIKFSCDDGSGGVTTYLTIDGSDSAIKVGKELQVNGDNRKLKLGAGNDLEIYHSGSQSYIDHTGTGNLYIRTRNNSSIYLQDTNNQAMAQFTDGSGCFFYHANNLKFSVISTGINVDGAIEMDKSLTMSHISDPSDPATGKSVIWSNTDGDLKIKINVGGTVVTRTLATFSD